MKSSLASSLVVRPVQLADESALARLHISSWQHAYRGILPDSYLDSLQLADWQTRWHNHIKDLTSDSYIFVAEDENHILGFCIVGPSRDADYGARVGELMGLYVNPLTTGKGVGSALHREAVTWFKEKKYQQVLLWVLKENRISRSFYERKGWVLEGSAKQVEKPGAVLDQVRYIQLFL